MARIRTIKPEFWTDYQLARDLPRDVRLFYISLWNEADDEGRLQAHPRRLLGACFPYDDDLSPKHIETWLEALERTERLVLYSHNGEPYAQLTKFARHQNINRPKESRLPAPPVTDESLTDQRGDTDASSPRARAPEGEQGTGKGNREQGTGTGELRAPARDPDPEPERPNPEEPEPSAKVIPLRPSSPDLPFRGQDWEGRTSGAVVLQEWIRLQPTPPGSSDRNRFRRVCQRLADQHTVGEIALAFIGMGQIWPHAPPPVGKGEPWNPDDLARRFSKALPAAMNHPLMQEEKLRREFEAHLSQGP